MLSRWRSLRAFYASRGNFYVDRSFLPMPINSWTWTLSPASTIDFQINRNVEANQMRNFYYDSWFCDSWFDIKLIICEFNKGIIIIILPITHNIYINCKIVNSYISQREKLNNIASRCSQINAWFCNQTFIFDHIFNIWFWYFGSLIAHVRILWFYIWWSDIQ